MKIQKASSCWGSNSSSLAQTASTVTTELWPPGNHKPSQPLYVYYTGGTECSSHTPGTPLSMCQQNPGSHIRWRTLHKTLSYLLWARLPTLVGSDWVGSPPGILDHNLSSLTPPALLPHVDCKWQTTWGTLSHHIRMSHRNQIAKLCRTLNQKQAIKPGLLSHGHDQPNHSLNAINYLVQITSSAVGLIASARKLKWSAIYTLC